MVRRVFKLVYGEVRGLHQAAYVLAFFALGSQLLALVRDRLLAHTFGAGGELDLYYAAFRIPDLMFALFSSVLSVYVLLPFVAKYRHENGEAGVSAFLSQMFTLFVGAYTLVALLLFVFAPQIIELIFPNFADQIPLVTLLFRILLLQPFLLGLSSLFGVITQMTQRFVLYAISPLIYNIGIIIGIVFLYPLSGVGLSGLAMGVVLGALGHLLIQLPVVYKSEWQLNFVREINWAHISSVFRVALPRAITLSIHQLVLLILISVATFMTAGSVSVFQFAYNLQSVPLAIIGMSYSVAAFPALAEMFAKKHHEEFVMHILTAFRHIIFWSLPVIALVIVLRAHIVRVILGSGEFSWSDTRLTAAVLAVFVVSLVFQSLILLLVRAFYAAGNTRTPLLIALFGGLASLLAALTLFYISDISPFVRNLFAGLFRLTEVPGGEVLMLAGSFVFGVTVQATLLVFLTAKMFKIRYILLLRQIITAFLAALATGLVSYLTLNFVVDGINQETFIGILLQGLVAGVAGLLATVITYHLLGSPELKEVISSFKAKILKSNVIAPQSDTL